MMKKTITVEKDSFDFLKLVYFGEIIEKEPIKAVSLRAYLDFCRTLRFKKISDENRLKLRKECIKVLEEKINELNAEDFNPKIFNNWHNATCEAIIKCNSKIFSYGQAQKWLNMTVKCLYISNFSYVFTYTLIFIQHRILDVLFQQRFSLGQILPVRQNCR